MPAPAVAIQLQKSQHSNIWLLLMLMLILQMHLAAETASTAAVDGDRNSSVNCSTGYQFQNGVCVDDDECQRVVNRGLEQTDVCGNYLSSSRRGYRCINTPGSFTCHRIAECGFGYKLNVETGSCDDVNECEQLGEQQACDSSVKICVNMPGTFRCDFKRCPVNRHLNRSTGKCQLCPSGFRPNLRGNCEDVDECATAHLHNCAPHMECVNYVGAFECRDRILCQMGMRPNYNGTLCVDVDECAESKHACYFGLECINTVGSFECEPKRCNRFQVLNALTGQCECNQGFTKNSQTGICVDKNECTDGSHQCTDNERCRNSRGGYDCIPRNRVCQPGLAMNFEETKCVDIDECSLGSFKCRRHEHCVNSYGSYECRCDVGFVNNGDKCIDINECLTNITSCPKTFECVNHIGNFSCQCARGFAQIGEVCKDVNECEQQPTLCSPGSCKNYLGGYSCSCPTGYVAKNSPPVCQDFDECLLPQNVCKDRTCVNTEGSYYCDCGHGYRWNFHLEACEDVNECKESNATCAGSKCFNYAGGHICYTQQCPAGFQLLKSVTTASDSELLGKVYFICGSVHNCTSITIGNQSLCAAVWQWQARPINKKITDQEVMVLDTFIKDSSSSTLLEAAIQFHNGTQLSIAKSELDNMLSIKEKFKYKRIMVSIKTNQITSIRSISASLITKNHRTAKQKIFNAIAYITLNGS